MPVHLDLVAITIFASACVFPHPGFATQRLAPSHHNRPAVETRLQRIAYPLRQANCGTAKLFFSL
ncbi:MAG: hypothetical protein EBX57_08340 [Betaproteobacteria bacterium]|nr:hypothetical protein [Betaproteobacteria bacterium]